MKTRACACIYMQTVSSSDAPSHFLAVVLHTVLLLLARNKSVVVVDDWFFCASYSLGSVGLSLRVPSTPSIIHTTQVQPHYVPRPFPGSPRRPGGRPLSPPRACLCGTSTFLVSGFQFIDDRSRVFCMYIHYITVYHMDRTHPKEWILMQAEDICPSLRAVTSVHPSGLYLSDSLLAVDL